MTREAEIIGGPHDGLIVALPDSEHTIRFPIMTALPPMMKSYKDMPELSVQAVELPLRLTSNGWRIYWNER